jgi:ATP/maltotriose-dependent transcriptional regulator MalT/DNA-binding SARP family transcriptional activator
MNKTENKENIVKTGRGKGPMSERYLPFAKITPPEPSGAIPRKRLFHLIDRCRKRPIVWITGPAGSGKTTLVSSYLKHRKLQCLWYQVDEGDGDLASFFYHMGLAVRKVAPRHKKPLPLLTPEYLQGVPTFTRRYAEELYRRLKPPFTMVLDNFQDASSSAFYGMIGNALETIPAGTNVIVLSRAEPPAPLARLRGNSRLAFIGWNDLSFTLTECRAFLKTKDGRPFPDETARQLHERTAGWAAGLVLMTETEKTKEIHCSMIGELSRQAVFNYFASEIFEKTGGETRDFLTKTSFFPSMTAEAAAALTGNEGAQSILSHLSRNHYFTDWRPLPEPVFQYHPLFRDFLQSRAKVDFESKELNEIRKRTAAILADEGRTEEAASLFIDAGEWEGLLEVVLRNAEALVVRGRHRVLEEWLRSLPADIIEKISWALYWLGICRMAFDPGEARAWLEKAFDRFRTESDEAGLFLSWAGIADTFIYELGDFSAADRWISEMEILLRQYPTFPSFEIESRVAFAVFCLMMFRQPQNPDLPLWEEKVMKVAEDTANMELKTLISAHLLLYHTWWSGEQAKAGLLLDTVGPSVQPGRIAALTLITWRAFEAAHYWMTANSDACLSSVKAGLAAAETSGIHIWDFVLLAQSTWAMTSNTSAEIGNHLRSMEFVTATNRRVDIFYYHYLLGWEALFLNKLARAEEHMRTALRLVKETGMAAPFGVAFTLMGLAEVLIESGEYDEAEEQLDAARDLGQEMKSGTVEYQYSWIHALLCLRRGDHKSALDDMRRHLAVSRGSGILNHPCWRASVMSPLYAKALEAGIETDHLRLLISRHKLSPPTPPETDDWPYPIKIYMLGSFRLLRDDQPVEFGGKGQYKPLTMLKALIAFGGREVSEERIIDLMWPDAEGDLGHKSFEITLLRLRRLLGKEGAVQLKGGTLSLDPRYCWTDVWAVEEIVGRTRETWADASPETIRLWERAIDMYKGHFLGSDSQQPWTSAMRERIRSGVLRIVASLGRRYESEARWEKAVECYQKGIETDDLAEEFYRGLMGCLVRLDREAEAVRVYHTCATALSSILGIAPSEKTTAMYTTILNR